MEIFPKSTYSILETEALKMCENFKAIKICMWGCGQKSKNSIRDKPKLRRKAAYTSIEI